MTVSQLKINISTWAWHHIDALMHHLVVCTFSMEDNNVMRLMTTYMYMSVSQTKINVSTS